MDDIWLHNVKINEVLSESYPQLGLNLWVIKIYGISDPIQILSAFLTWFGLGKTLADTYCVIRNGKGLGKASWIYVKTLFDVSIPTITTITSYVLVLSEDCMPAWFLLLASLGAHPVLRWIVYRKSLHKDEVITEAKSGSRHATVEFNTTLIILILLGHIPLIVSKRLSLM